MNCNKLREKLSLYIDDELYEDEKKLIDEHLKYCPECKKELEDYKNIIQTLNHLPNEEPPEGYCKRLHEKLLNTTLSEINEINEKNEEVEISKMSNLPKKTKNKKIRWLKYGSLAAAVVLVFLVHGLTNNSLMSKSNNEMAYDSAKAESPAEYAPAPESEPMAPEENGGVYEYSISNADMDIMGSGSAIKNGESTDQVTLMAVDEREMKIIKSGNIHVQTKDYDKFMADMTEEIESLGGFIERNNTEVYQVYENDKLMYGSLKIRIPQESFYEAVTYLEETTEIRRKNINETDVTKGYYEKDNKVKNLEIQEQHLRDLFDKATTVDEMLKIENELRRIRTEIDALNTSLSDINDRASMSTIDLEVEEVKEVNFTLKGEEGVWERAKEGFINTVNSLVRGIENLLINLVSSSPILIPVIIIFVILLMKIKKYWKRKL